MTLALRGRPGTAGQPLPASHCAPRRSIGEFMKLLYFAWVRTNIGKAEEDLSPPPQVRNVEQLLNWLAERGPNYAAALDRRNMIKVAVNQEYVDPDAPVAPGDEVALFPPVTGG
jgi:molybdopterin synthase sulfur carrier subunit